MKKKLLGLIVFALSAIFLVACSKNSLDGKYYRVYNGEKTLIMSIKGNGGSIDFDGKDFAIVNVDNDSKQVTISGELGNRTYNLNPTKDGRVNEPGIGYKTYLYKEDSKALEHALKVKK